MLDVAAQLSSIHAIEASNFVQLQFEFYACFECGD